MRDLPTPDLAEAAAGSALIMGKSTNSAGTRNTKMTTNSAGGGLQVVQKGPGSGLIGYSSAVAGAGRGVYGRTDSPDGNGIAAINTAVAGQGAALRADGGHNPGVIGSSADSYGVRGTGGYAGLSGTGGAYGGILSGTSVGAYGSGPDYAVYGAGGTYGVYASGTGYGVFGYGPSGVYGFGSTYGVVGTTSNVNSDAVRGDGGQYGVHGVNARTAGIRGDSDYVGAWGQGAAYGVFGLATATSGTTYGVFGQASNASSYALWAQGNAAIAGTLSKSAGSFKIDHPLDPEHRWLAHSFVESPDMLNVYSGTADLDADGAATIHLPDYFDALNRDVRYQLTALGGPAPSLHVAREARDNAFRIAGGAPGGRVSWQVTGIRQDDYAKAHPIVVETPKTADERGTRLFVPKGSNARRYLPAPIRPKGDARPTPIPSPQQLHPDLGGA